MPVDEYVRRELTEPLDADFHLRYRDDPTRVAALWPAATNPVFESAMAAAAFGELSAEAEWIDPERTSRR